MFFCEKFDKNENNQCKTCQAIKSLLPNNEEVLLTINKIVVNDNEIYETTAIADHFDNCFANVGNKLAQTHVDQDKQLFLKFLSKRSPTSIFW